MANSAEKISFSAFQKKLLASSLFPAADSDITIHTCSVPPIPRLFPQNLRISFQHLCSPKEKMQSMYHKNLVLKVHLKGTSTGIVDGMTYVFTPGTAMLVFPFQQHWILHTGSPDKPEAMQERMLFNFLLPADELKVLLPLKDRIFALEKEDYPLLLEIAERLQRKTAQEQAVCPYLLNLFLFRCLARVSPYERKTSAVREPTVVQTILSYIRNQYKKNPTVAMMASDLNMSETRLRQLIRRETRLSPGMLIRSLRLKNAAELLCFTDRKISDISRQCGFPNPFTFSRAFRRKYGLPPQRFRSECKNQY